MKAWVLQKVGAEPILTKMDTQAKLEINEVIVSLSHSALNHRDLWIMAGKYPAIQLPCVLGSDGCGTSQGESVIINPGMNWGENEKAQSPDFHIIGMPRFGTFAEMVSVPKTQIYRKPSFLSPEEGAAIPLAGVTAYRALVTKCEPKPSQKVLITGIGGGVALWAFQFAKALDCEVFVTSRNPAKIAESIRLGASGGVCTTEDDWPQKLQKISGGFDIIVDSIMGNTLPSLVKICNPGADISFYGAGAGNTDLFQPHNIFWRQITLHGSTMGSPQDFQNMLTLVETYKIRPIIDRVFAFRDLPLALERLKSSQQYGKIILNHAEL